MADVYEDRQALINALIEETKLDQIPQQKRLLSLAKIGMDNPAALTPMETKEICVALVVHYHQMGISL